jgi:PAS domain-containing protein
MRAGLISEEEAKANAISRIEHLRYGVDNKDYFWITDMHPIMIMHPYRPDLNGADLTDFTDPNGKTLFVEMVQRINELGEGYIDYEWQWMDNSSRIVPKISYVRAFEPWGWIIGTGVYIEDVKSEIAAIKKRLTLVSLAITGCMAFLLVLIARQNLKGEIKRNQAEQELKVSREQYKALVEASTEGTSMFLENECIFSNRKFQEILGIELADHISPDLHEIIVPDRLDDIDRIRRFDAGTDNFMLIETVVTTRNNVPQSALLSLSKVSLSEKRGLIVVVKELSRDDRSDEERSERGRQLLALADVSRVGMFKCTAGKSARLLDVNDHLVTMLGYSSKESLLKVELSDLVDDDEELRSFSEPWPKSDLPGTSPFVYNVRMAAMRSLQFLR